MAKGSRNNAETQTASVVPDPRKGEPSRHSRPSIRIDSRKVKARLCAKSCSAMSEFQKTRSQRERRVARIRPKQAPGQCTDRDESIRVDGGLSGKTYWKRTKGGTTRLAVEYPNITRRPTIIQIQIRKIRPSSQIRLQAAPSEFSEPKGLLNTCHSVNALQRDTASMSCTNVSKTHTWHLAYVVTYSQ